MANLRDGGLVTLGVADERGQPLAVGLGADELESWSRYEDVVAALGEFAQPGITFDLELIEFRGARIALLRVHEFTEVPILCARDAQDEKQKQVLRRGACYVRPKRRVETAEVATQDEMRELIDLAIEKGVRRFVSVAYAAGLAPGAPAPSSDTRYDEELDDFR